MISAFIKKHPGNSGDDDKNETQSYGEIIYGKQFFWVGEPKADMEYRIGNSIFRKCESNDQMLNIFCCSIFTFLFSVAFLPFIFL